MWALILFTYATRCLFLVVRPELSLKPPMLSPLYLLFIVLITRLKNSLVPSIHLSVLLHFPFYSKPSKSIWHQDQTSHHHDFFYGSLPLSIPPLSILPFFLFIVLLCHSASSGSHSHWSWAQQSSCLNLPSAVIKDLHHHLWLQFLFLSFLFCFWYRILLHSSDRHWAHYITCAAPKLLFIMLQSPVCWETGVYHHIWLRLCIFSSYLH